LFAVNLVQLSVEGISRRRAILYRSKSRKAERLKNLTDRGIRADV